MLSVVFLIAFLASFSELQRMRTRFGEVTRHAFHDHADIRLTVIRSEMAQAERPIVVFGDSVAELASFPNQICGRQIVNAGIGGATLHELTRIASEINGASLVVVVAGTNDAGSNTFRKDYARLLGSLRVGAIATPATVYPNINREIMAAAKEAGAKALDVEFSEFADVHPTPKAYREWTRQVTESLSEECAR
ncbi:SGNH/GDSL hydrolase family protein [Bradyrhizobium diazoefficiens]